MNQIEESPKGALLQIIPLAKGPRAAVFTQASSRLEFELFPMAATVSASALAPRPNARSTMRASPWMSCVRLKIALGPCVAPASPQNP
jgi:hypothetical protein